MGVRLIRILCLACGLLLALPPAWCCWTPQPAPAAQPESAPASCCHKETAPKPAPAAPPAQCPCYDRQTVAPAGSVKVAADLSPALSPVVAVADSPRAGPPAAAAPIAPPPSRPLHLLRCVWLC
jgi:hypothetical protein